MAHGHYDDGLSFTLFAEALLADEIQCELPRMRPSENGGFQPNVVMSDRELAQVTFAMRIFDHDVDISYSTREPAAIRDHMATLGVTTMSAESKTEPGGYYTYPQALEQFHVSDERTAVEVEKALRKAGREPVWKDWDASFDLKTVGKREQRKARLPLPSESDLSKSYVKC